MQSEKHSSVALALLSAPDRHGWRGNGESWVRRAQSLIFETGDTGALRLLAPAIDDPRLLRPALACAMPLSPPIHQPRPSIKRSGLRCQKNDGRCIKRDIEHILHTRSVKCYADTAYIGALAFFVRMHPRISTASLRRLAIACRPGTLALTMCTTTWLPFGVAPNQRRTRVCTVLVALAIDELAESVCVDNAVRWLHEQPKSQIPSYVNNVHVILRDRGLHSIETGKCVSDARQEIVGPPFTPNPTPSHPNKDILSSGSLQFFRQEDWEEDSDATVMDTQPDERENVTH